MHSFKRIRQIADRISEEHNLSTIENPGLSKGANQRYKKPTKRNGFTGIIDDVLSETLPKNFDEFLKQLEKRGCKIRRRGNTISVRPPGVERFFRFKSGKKGLPDGYDEESLRKKIAEMQTELQSGLRDGFDSKTETVNGEVHADAEIHENILSSETGAGVPLEEEFISVTGKNSSPETDTSADEGAAEPSAKYIHDKKINLLIDIQNSIKAQNSPGYDRWAKIFNLKQAAQTLLFLQDNGITEIEKLNEKAQGAKDDFNDLNTRIQAIDTRLKDISTLQKHIGTYSKTRDVFVSYRKSGYSKKYLTEHEQDISAHKTAKQFFDSVGRKKLPTIKTLQTEYAVLLTEKKSLYAGYHEARKYMQEILTVKQNTEQLLNYRDDTQTKGNERI